jgi:hypothetical protein
MKNKLAKLLGLKASQLSVTGTTSGSYVVARIRPNRVVFSKDSLLYPGEFPEELRRKALVAVYGNAEWIKAPYCAGNVGHYCIAITAGQWELVLA